MIQCRMKEEQGKKSEERGVSLSTHHCRALAAASLCRLEQRWEAARWWYEEAIRHAEAVGNFLFAARALVGLARFAIQAAEHSAQQQQQQQLTAGSDHLGSGGSGAGPDKGKGKAGPTATSHTGTYGFHCW